MPAGMTGTRRCCSVPRGSSRRRPTSPARRRRRCCAGIPCRSSITGGRRKRWSPPPAHWSAMRRSMPTPPRSPAARISRSCCARRPAPSSSSATAPRRTGRCMNCTRPTMINDAALPHGIGFWVGLVKEELAAYAGAAGRPVTGGLRLTSASRPSPPRGAAAGAWSDRRRRAGAWCSGCPTASGRRRANAASR